jgi:hypothetical protein
VALKFAAGTSEPREQLSSTWIVRVSGAEIYVLNRDAGGEHAHVSMHKDGRCHAKFTTAPGVLERVYTWTLPAPLPGTNVRRLADVVIPHRGLLPSVAHVAPDDDTVLGTPPT